MGFFDIFTKADKPVASRDVISRAVSGGWSNWSGTNYGTTAWDMDHALSHAYERVVWVFRCVHTIAANQASVTIKLRDNTTTQGALVPDPDFERLMNRQSNPFEDSWRFRYRLSSQLLLSPVGAFIEVVKAPSGKIVELYLLDPGSVDPIKSSTNWVDGYWVKRADGRKDKLEPDDVIWLMNFPHPIDPYRNVTPLEAAGVSIDTDYFARLYNRNFLKNDGRPGMLIGIDADMTSEDAQELKAIFSGGFSRAGETRVVDSKGLSVVDLTVRPRDAQWEVAIESAKNNILAAFGVPESVLGNAAGRCLRASEFVFLANGQVKRAEELVGQDFELLQPRNGSFRVVPARAEYALKEKIYKITTFSGRTLETNGEHPLFMSTSISKGPFKREIFPHGWTTMRNIKASYDRHDCHNTSALGSVYTEVAVPVMFEAVQPVDSDPDAAWDAGEQGQCIPEYLFTANEETQRAFVSGLYSKYGRLSQHTSLDLYPPNLEFAKRLQRLLQRLGVYASISNRKMRHLITVSGKINMFNFLSQLDLQGDAATRADAVWDRLEADTSREQNSFRSDGLPAGMIWDRVYSIEEVGDDQTVAITVKDGDHSYLSTFWEHNTYNNADTEDEGFWTGTMRTHCESISRALEPLTGDLSDSVHIQFMYEEIDVLQKAERRREDKYKQEFLSGAITLDALRVALGEEPLDLPHTRVLYLPNGVIVGSPEDVQVVRNSQLNPQQIAGAGTFGVDPALNPFTAGPTGANGVVGGANDQVQGELAAVGSPQATQTINDQAARVLRSARQTQRTPLSVNPNSNVDLYDRIDAMTSKTYVREVKQINTHVDEHRDIKSRVQGFLEGTIDSWSDRQLKIASERLNHAKVRKGTRHWDGEPGNKSLDVSYVVPVADWDTDIQASVKEFLCNTAIRAAYAEANRLKDLGFAAKGGYFFDQDTVYGMANNVVMMISASATNQSDLAAKHIGVLDGSGKSISEIQQTLVPTSFDRQRWSAALSKKATTHILEELYNHIYTNVDGRAYKIWHTGRDELLRAAHASLEGKMIPVSSQFEVGGEYLRFPTDTGTDQGENCSCWLYYGVDV